MKRLLLCLLFFFLLSTSHLFATSDHFGFIEPPVVTNTPGKTIFVSGVGGVTIDPGITVSDPDSDNASMATIFLSNRPDGGEEFLLINPAFVNLALINGITVTYNFTSGELTLTGVAPFSVYQTLLSSLIYNNVKPVPDTQDRLVYFTVFDEDGNESNQGLKVIEITNVIAVITDVEVPLDGLYGIDDVLDFKVTFSRPVIVAGGTPFILLNIGGTLVRAEYVSGSGTNELVFRYIVEEGVIDLDGISIEAWIDLDGATIRDEVNDDANLSLSPLPDTSGILVDGIRPFVESITLPADGVYGICEDEPLVFTLNLNENVSVDTGAGTMVLELQLGSETVNATYDAAASSSNTLVFVYLIQESDQDGDGIQINQLLLNGTLITDQANNELVDTGFDNTEVFDPSGIIIDNTKPESPSITGITEDTGVSDEDGITSDQTLIISGTSPSAGTVIVYLDGVEIGETDVAGSGPWSFDYSGTSLAEGNYELSAALVDDRCNESELSAPFEITIDVTAPEAIGGDITVELGAGGLVSINPEDLNNGSTDNFTANADLIFEADITQFSCDQVGDNEVVLTVTDQAGNSSTTTVTVTVVDTNGPEAITQNITVTLDENGEASILPEDIDAGSTATCDTEADLILSLDKDFFTCADLGENTVQLTATDQNGNSVSAPAIVTVVDNLAPTAVVQNLTLTLDADGLVTVNPADVDNGSSDNCTPQDQLQFELSQNVFTCDDAGTNTVTFTVRDLSGNESTAQVTIIIQDDVAPVAIAQNITVELGADGTVSVTPNQVNNGSTDNCSDALVFTLDVDTFTCDDLGENPVVLTVTDPSGNSDTANAVVTVVNTAPPVIDLDPITVSLDANGQASISAEDISAGIQGACGIDDITLSQTEFDCGDIGNNAITVTVTDLQGNTTTATITVTVVDESGPVLSQLPGDQNVTGDISAQFTLPDYLADIVAVDNCGLASITQSPAAGTVLTGFDQPNPITITATDVNGNVTTYTFNVTIIGRIIEEVIEPAVITVPWGTPINTLPLPIRVDVRFVSGQIRPYVVNWIIDNYDELVPGIYQNSGTLVLPDDVLNPNNLQPVLTIIVEDKRPPEDILLDNNTFKAAISNNIFVGTFTTVDPDDDIHFYELVGTTGDNQYFSIIDDQLFWTSDEVLPGRTDFTITVSSTDRTGNTITKSFTIIREIPGLDELKIVNVFSPNDDGVNDVWKLDGLRFFNQASVRVFERSGKLIFSSDETSFSWDGTYNGREMAAGAYYFVIELPDTGERLRGVLTLLRD
ncbi:T9SS type B sorting domain-containing protein [Pararhodonellum marinum]|uniref:T9SS type B sorting domain-containing protein n=1 Tax=Pararhodonellum marinum TaxID=2755358 RepID=UPI0018905288|nr:T9SS type B sorting domain-containing protein [Pararhodonellum marinum]